MTHHIPPHAVAQLDQYFAEAAEKWHELADLLRKTTAEYGEYEAMAMMAKSLEVASQETLISMVVTAMRLHVKHTGEHRDDDA
jgi:hypothetical protein